MNYFKKVNIFTLCLYLLSESVICSEEDALLVMEKKNLLGLKLSLASLYQVPISEAFSTELLTEKLLNDPEGILRESKAVENPEDFNVINDHPFALFDVCGCMPCEVYVFFSKKIVKQAVTLYKQKDSNQPFVWGSFASGGLFVDLYVLTEFVQELRKQKIKDIHLQVNLIDTDLRDYIFKHSGGLGRTTVEKQPVHSHLVFFKETSNLLYSNAADTSELLIDFLQWFTQNLDIKLDLYVYGTGQDYVYDHEKKRVFSHDILLALDYVPQSYGDLAQLAARTIKKGGCLCSLNNKDIVNLPVDEKLVIPQSYKELAELAKQEAEVLDLNNQELEEQDIEEENQDNIIDMVISQKSSDISANRFKSLLQQARGDNTKIGKLFYPLFYPDSKNFMFQSEKLQKSLRFKPLDYFVILYKNHEIPLQQAQSPKHSTDLFKVVEVVQDLAQQKAQKADTLVTVDKNKISNVLEVVDMLQSIERQKKQAKKTEMQQQLNRTLEVVKFVADAIA
ncbi:MAG: hypothetical protein NTZ68_00925 [Candidatus Dependentiae bacterium]|nr:hypothetical protein [Candidatus Dependentiae bacterium]